jgi:hypothetical protein
LDHIAVLRDLLLEWDDVQQVQRLHLEIGEELEYLFNHIRDAEVAIYKVTN